MRLIVYCMLKTISIFVLYSIGFFSAVFVILLQIESQNPNDWILTQKKISLVIYSSAIKKPFTARLISIQ